MIRKSIRGPIRETRTDLIKFYKLVNIQETSACKCMCHNILLLLLLLCKVEKYLCRPREFELFLSVPSVRIETRNIGYFCIFRMHAGDYFTSAPCKIYFLLYM